MGRSVMTEEFLDKDVTVSGGRSIPEWMWKNPFSVRFFRSAIEEASGPIGAGESLEDAFHRGQPFLEMAAARKIKSVLGDFEPPMAITAQDVLA